MSVVPRRALLALAGTLFAVLAALAPTRAQTPSSALRQIRIEVDGPFGQREPVLVTLPLAPEGEDHPPGTRWPLLVALHGLGEAQRGPQRGYLGWSVDYGLPRVYEAVLRGRVDAEVLGGMVRDAHMRRIAAWLEGHPFRGVAVVTPYTPAILGPENAGRRQTFHRWVADALLRQVRARFPNLARTRDGTGIDGVSLGGRLSLEVGFRHPEAFSAVGGIQPAAREEVSYLARLADPAAQQRIRLLSSDADPLLETTRQISSQLVSRRVPHDLVVTPGAHDYSFNRGPGSLELLRFASTALRPEASSSP